MPPIRILVVCVGNMCRSPLAERLLQAQLDAVSPGAVVVSSAGTEATDGREMDPRSAAQLVRLGGDPTGFGAIRLQPAMAQEADVVLTLTRNLRTEVLWSAPRSMRRTFTLGEFAAACSQAPDDLGSIGELVTWAAASRSRGANAPDVVDPRGEPVVIHQQAADQIAGFVAAITPRVAALIRAV